MNGKSLLFGFIAGGIIGGAVTLLSTPKSGPEVQKLVVTNVTDLIDSISSMKEKTLKLKDQVESVAIEGVETFKNVSKDMQSSFQDWKNDVEPTMADIQNSIKELHATIDQLENEIKAPIIRKA